MKKTIKLCIVSILAILIINSNNIDAKSQNLSKIAKSQYDNETKELYLWGANHVGNLGTGNYSDISEENKVRVNDFIDNQKIIEYAITDSQTYVLTNKNKVYASGYNVGDGRVMTKRSTFVELKFYNQSKYRITSFNVFYNSKSNCKSDIGYDDKCYTNIKFNTTNTKVSSTHFHPYYITTTPGIRNWSNKFVHYDYKYGKITKKYPIYNDVRNNNKVTAVVDNKGKLLSKYIINKKQRKYKKYYYNKGQINYYRSYSDHKDVIIRYKNGKKSSGNIIYYKLLADKGRSKKGEHKYTYNNGTLKTRYSYKKVGKKMIITTKKFYYPNRKKQFKSNNNGKARCYITYYKKGKAYVTYRYKYNSKGKMVNKTKVKIKKVY